jgi:hypothetical protein
VSDYADGISADHAQGIGEICSVDLNPELVPCINVDTSMFLDSDSDSSKNGSGEDDASDAGSFYWNYAENNDDIMDIHQDSSMSLDLDDSMNDLDQSPEDLDSGFDLDQSPDNLDSSFFNFPKSLKNLQADLLGDYTVPVEPPPLLRNITLSACHIASLKHYVAWKKSNGTIQAFNLHRQVLSSSTGLEILSLFKVQKLAMKLTDFHPIMVDMCPNSCIAYTGQYRDFDKCPFFYHITGLK